MAIYSPNDASISIIFEPTAGVTPTTGVPRYILPTAQDQAPIAFTSADIVSDTKRPNGAAAGSQRGPITGEGTLDMRLQLAPVYLSLFESVLRNKFTTTGTKTLKPGNTETTFSVLSLIAPGAANTAMVDIAANCQATKFTLDAKAGEGATVNFDVMSLAQTLATTDNAITLTDLPAAAYEYTGADIGTLTIAGNTSLIFTELNLEVGQPRAARLKLGSNIPVGMGTSELREVKLTFRAYRESFALDALLTGQKQAFSFNIGGYGFFVFGMAKLPTTAYDSESIFVDVEVTGAYDATAAADVYITQL